MNLYNLLLYGSLSAISVSGLFVISGLCLIKYGYRDYHKYAMSSAAFFALIFVVLYLTRTSLYPHTSYAGGHRILYFTVLWSHTLLSVVNFPMVVAAIYLAMKKDFERHKRIAPYTAGIWIYVALTGWLIRIFI